MRADFADPDSARLEAGLAAGGDAPAFGPLFKGALELSMRSPAWTAGFLGQLLAHPRLADDPALHCRVWMQYGFSLMNLRRLDDADAALQRAADLAVAVGEHGIRLRARGAHVWLRIRRFDLAGAAVLAPQVFDEALALGEPSALVLALEGLAVVASCCGRHERADALYRQALLTLRVSPQAMRPSVEASQLHNHCVGLMLAVLDAYNTGREPLLRTRLAAMQPVLAEAVAAAERTGSALLRQGLRPLQTLHATLAGQPGTEPWTPEPRQMNAPYAHLANAWLARRRGDYRTALQEAESAMEEAAADPHEFAVPLAALRELSSLHAGRGHWPAAWRCTQHAQALAQQRDDEQAHYAVAEALARMRGERSLAAAIVGQDLRTPVAAIQALAAAPVQREAVMRGRLADIARLADRALRHADDFLRGAELLNLDTRHWTDLYLPGLVAEAVDEARHAGDGALPVDEHVESDLLLRSHARTLHRVLLGLLLDAQAAGCTRVQVSACGQGDTVLLQVQRQGRGLSLAGLRSVFDEGGLPEGDGAHRAGFGLRYVAMAAHALHGVATAVNHPDGSGATVALALPRTPAAGV